MLSIYTPLVSVSILSGLFLLSSSCLNGRGIYALFLFAIKYFVLFVFLKHNICVCVGFQSIKLSKFRFWGNLANKIFKEDIDFVLFEEMASLSDHHGHSVNRSVIY